MKTLILVTFMVIFAGACGGPSTNLKDSSAPEVLTVYPDGTLEFRNRIMNENEVIIYSDGKGGERAAVRVWNPLRPESRKDSVYFRDTIIVERIESEDVN